MSKALKDHKCEASLLKIEIATITPSSSNGSRTTIRRSKAVFDFVKKQTAKK